MHAKSVSRLVNGGNHLPQLEPTALHECSSSPLQTASCGHTRHGLQGRPPTQRRVCHKISRLKTDLLPELAVKVSLVVVSEELWVIAEDSHSRGPGGDLCKKQAKEHHHAGVVRTAARPSSTREKTMNSPLSQGASHSHRFGTRWPSLYLISARKRKPKSGKKRRVCGKSNTKMSSLFATDIRL